MQKEKIKLSQTFEYDDGTSLDYSFIGLENVDEYSEADELQNVVTNIFKSKSSVPTIIEATTIIKNVFRTLEEEHLDINIWKDKDFMEMVNYLRDNLNMYYYNMESNENNIANITFEHHQKKGTNFSITKTRKNRKKETEYSDFNNVKELFNKKINTLCELQNIKMIKLSQIDKIICTIYRLFYQSNPNFSRKKDQILAQSMFAFLTDFGISLPASQNDTNDIFCFSLMYNQTMVTSLQLSQILDQLAPLGEIKENISFVKLNKDAQQTIGIIGKEIREHMNSKPNPVEWFKDFVKVNYIKSNCVPANSTHEEIAGESQCPETEVKSNLKLVKKINDKVYQN